jgi:predicted RNA-binding protein YlqC (UPF0109 family)
MIDLVNHLVKPIVSNPDSVSVKAVDGEAVVMLELVVDPTDRARVSGQEGRTMRALRTVISAAAGQKKATLDLVGAHGEDAADEE